MQLNAADGEVMVKLGAAVCARCCCSVPHTLTVTSPAIQDAAEDMSKILAAKHAPAGLEEAEAS